MIRTFFPQGPALACLLALGACAELDRLNMALGGGQATAPAATQPAAPQAAIPTSAAQTAERLDQTTAVERAAAIGAAPSGQPLGQTVASLGTPTEPGFWLKTPLVTVAGSGQVRDRTSGRRVAVTLIPIDGPPTAGSRLSLPAMRALGVALTDLVTLDVIG